MHPAGTAQAGRHLNRNQTDIIPLFDECHGGDTFVLAVNEIPLHDVPSDEEQYVLLLAVDLAQVTGQERQPPDISSSGRILLSEEISMHVVGMEDGEFCCPGHRIT